MTKLELAQRLRQKAGIAGSGPTTTIGQTGELAHIVNWIDEAYEHVQNEYQSWAFLRNDFTFNTVAATAEYTAATIATDLAEWQPDTFRIYKTATGFSDEQWLDYVRWKDFRDAYMLASQRTESGRPTRHTIIRDEPADGIRLYPVPDDIYTVIGEYWQIPDTMSADTDTPIIPERFHMIIVWKALEYYGSYNEEPNRESMGRQEYDRLLALMSQSQLTKVTLGRPLA
jgi:hypothetical protein